MKKNALHNLTKTLTFLFFISLSFSISAQVATPPKAKSDFWNKVQIGGGLGLSDGSGFTDITIAPSAIYNFNQYVSLGTGLQASFVSSKGNYSSTILGGSLITLFNPIEQIQLSAELEEMNVSTKYELVGSNVKDNFWNTALYLGAGYRAQNVTIGARYNVLFDKDKSVYSDALMPFVRVYF